MAQSETELSEARDASAKLEAKRAEMEAQWQAAAAEADDARLAVAVTRAEAAAALFSANSRVSLSYNVAFIYKFTVSAGRTSITT